MSIKNEIEFILSSMIDEDGTIYKQFQGTKWESCTVEIIENWLSIIKNMTLTKESPRFPQKECVEYIPSDGAIDAECILARIYEKNLLKTTKSKLYCSKVITKEKLDKALELLVKHGYVKKEIEIINNRVYERIVASDVELNAFYIVKTIRGSYKENVSEKYFSVTYQWLKINCDMDESDLVHGLYFLRRAGFLTDVSSFMLDTEHGICSFNSIILEEGALFDQKFAEDNALLNLFKK